MPRLFGTDGIRGVANVDLKPTLAYALGRATAHQLAGKGGAIVVGQDTRRSGDMFVVGDHGRRDEPRRRRPRSPAASRRRPSRSSPAPATFAAGIMVSASHNPAEDNGLKVLDAAGLKLDDAIEDELEQLIWRTEELGSVAERRDRPGGRRPRRCSSATASTGWGSPAAIDGGGLRIVLDCANGSGGMVGPEILAATGATVEVIHNEPDGVNINVESGATAPASLAREVAARGADVGFALDGDADRLHRGRRGRPGRRRRPGAGHPRARPPRAGRPARGRARRVGLSQRRAAVGDRGGRRAGRPDAGRRQVHPRGDAGVSGAGLGGEKSGHVIVLEHTTSGDGIVTALEVLRVMTRTGRADRGSRRPDPAPAPAAARGQGPPQGPVGGRSGPPARDPRRRAAARRRRPGPRPAVRNGARAAGDGRGPGRRPRRRAGRRDRGARGRATKLTPLGADESPGTTGPGGSLPRERRRNGRACAESSATPGPARRGRS